MTVELYHGDCLSLMEMLLEDNSVDSCVTDPPYHLTSIVKRFGGENAAPAKSGKTGAYARASAGFMGQKWDGGDIAFRAETWAEVYRVLKPGGYLLAFSGSRTYHRMACAVEDAGFEIRDQIMWLYGSGFPKSHNLDGEWEGWGTALKPAHEPIVLARKPLVGTVKANVEAHGVGALNIDPSRIPYADEADMAQATPQERCTSGNIVGGGVDAERADFQRPEQKGRWPANVLHDGSDEVLAAFPEAKGQQGGVGPKYGPKSSVNVYGDYGPRDEFNPRGDTGSAARFFYCAKASRADREAGLEGFEKQAAGMNSETSGQHITRRDEGYEVAKRANNHPTVKPTELMRYLCRLVTPPGGTVLDPFMGSGSTGRGAVSEGFKFIGMEQDKKYLAIARARIADVA